MSLKIRIIPILLWNGKTLGITTRFKDWRPVGQPLQAINVFQMREADEILFLDITATMEGRSPDFKLVKELARECFVPLTVGGGIKTVDDVARLLEAGADRVVIRSAGLSVVVPASGRFGKQAIVGCIEDGQRDGEGYCNLCCSNDCAVASEAGCGEVLVMDVPRDGTMQGYEPTEYLDAFRVFNKEYLKVQIPLIAAGGAGTYEHFAQAIDAGASAVAAGAMWYFTEQTPLEAKKYLAARGYSVRL